jgi:hypothetical protein
MDLWRSPVGTHLVIYILYSPVPLLFSGCTALPHPARIDSDD